MRFAPPCRQALSWVSARPAAVGRGILLAERSRFAPAVAALERASQIEPDNAAYRTVLGMALAGGGARDAAITGAAISAAVT